MSGLAVRVSALAAGMARWSPWRWWVLVWNTRPAGRVRWRRRSEEPQLSTPWDWALKKLPQFRPEEVVELKTKQKNKTNKKQTIKTGAELKLTNGVNILENAMQGSFRLRLDKSAACNAKA